MKKIRLLPSLVRPAKDQDPDGKIIVSRGGDTSGALNLTSRTPGIVEAVSDSAVVAQCGREPSIIDSREGCTLLLSISENGELRLEGSIHPADGWTPIEQVIGNVPEPVASYTSAGEFLVLVLKSGSLYFLLWHPDLHIYTSPGLFPSMPKISLREISEVEIMSEVAPLKFSSETDLRSGVPSAIAREAEKNVRHAWESLRSHAARSGRWIQPVLVREVVRLWNGSCLHVGSPRLVGGCGWQGTARVSLPLTGASGAFTGTGAGELTVRSFEIEADAQDFPQGHWTDIIRSIEFWVSEEINPVATASATAGYVAGSAYLHISLPSEGASSLSSALVASPMKKSVKLRAAGKIRLRRSDAAETAILRATDNSLSRIRVRTALGHAGFLHLGGIRRADPLPLCPLASGTQTLIWRAEVKLGDPGSSRSVTVCGEANGVSPELAPFFWYPDASARSIVLAACDAGGQWYEKEFPLSAAPCSESAAMIFNPRLESSPLEEVEAPSVVPAAQSFVAHPSALITMSRGNPFVESSSTSSVGGEISVLSPQITGGGAFTRQYIYCFTDKGIMALNHDMNGRHTNCRQISTMQVLDERAVIATDEGLYALTINGSLLSVRDSKVSVVMRGMGSWREIAWQSSYSRLWLLPESHLSPARIISISGKIVTASMRWPPPSKLLSRSSPILFSSASDPAEIRMPDVAGMPVVMARWESAPILIDMSGIVRFSVNWPKPPEDVEIEIWHQDPAGRRSMLFAIHSDSSAPALQQGYFMLPVACTFPDILRGNIVITVAGYFAALGAMELEEVVMPPRRS